ncbi:Tigger transposable element-derived protein 4 [Orchesella cincta]|uniref:Tigger transposable element-derived protein 4 n=1 Tax=Orchesella cincta TaxID=48709 RepID=A0A1D2N2N1_ORCCI|nr:Tigger transposable element-derived protein 4 [Orchesella cincta]
MSDILVSSVEPVEEIVGENGLIHTFIKVSHSDDEADEEEDDGINLDDEFAMVLGKREEEEEEEDISLSSSSSEEEESTSGEEDDDLLFSEEEKVADSSRKRKRDETSAEKRSKERPRKSSSKPPQKRMKGNSKRSRKSNDDDEDEESDDDSEVVGPQKGPNNLYNVQFKLQVLKYFETHSAKKTADKFAVSLKRVREWQRSKEKIEAESQGVHTRRPRGDNYTIEEKLQAIAFSEQHSIHEATLLYNVHKRTIEKWVQKKEQMEAIIHEGLGARKRRGGGGRKPQYTHIEKDLRDWIVALRLQGVRVNYRMILNKAKTLLRKKDATSQDLPAPSTITWVVKFLARHNLVGQLGTTLGEEDPQKLVTQIPGSNDQGQNISTTTGRDLLGQIDIPENPNQRNRRTITLDDKVSIIERIQKGETQSNVARALKVAQSTIQTIWTSRNQILERFQDPQRKAKIVHWKKYSDIDEALHTWFADAVSKNTQVDGKVLVDKAIQLCEMFNKPEFKTQANKWTEVFCKKHGIQNLAIPAEPESLVSITPISQNQQQQTTSPVTVPPVNVKPPDSNEKDDYADFFLTTASAVSVSVENYDSQRQDVQIMQSNFSSPRSNFLLQVPPQPQPDFPNVSTSEDNNISTHDALKYIELLRKWVHGNYGANDESLNNHLNALEIVALKRHYMSPPSNSKKDSI